MIKKTKIIIGIIGIIGIIIIIIILVNLPKNKDISSFVNFNNIVNDTGNSTYPWRTKTWYKYSYVDNSVDPITQGPLSDMSDVVFVSDPNDSSTNPKIGFDANPNYTINLYRALEDSVGSGNPGVFVLLGSDFILPDHTYIDTDNPYKPQPTTFYYCNGKICDISKTCTQVGDNCYTDSSCNNKCNPPSKFYSCDGNKKCNISTTCKQLGDNCYADSGCNGCNTDFYSCYNNDCKLNTNCKKIGDNCYTDTNCNGCDLFPKKYSNSCIDNSCKSDSDNPVYLNVDCCKGDTHCSTDTGKYTDNTPGNFFAVGDPANKGDNATKGKFLYRGNWSDHSVNFQNQLGYINNNYGINVVFNLTGCPDPVPIGNNTTMILEIVPLDKYEYQGNIIVIRKLLEYEKNGKKVFVHCQHGANRTGRISALWRMINATSFNKTGDINSAVSIFKSVLQEIEAGGSKSSGSNGDMVNIEGIMLCNQSKGAMVKAGYGYVKDADSPLELLNINCLNKVRKDVGLDPWSE